MNITTVRDKPKPGKHDKSSVNERFQKQWQKVQALQKKNLRLRDDVHRFATSIIAKIAPTEKQLAVVNVQLVEKLLNFAERKSLVHWQREELLEWAQQMLLSLSDNPFASTAKLDELHARLGEHIRGFLSDDDDAAHDDEIDEGDEPLFSGRYEQSSDCEEAFDSEDEENEEGDEGYHRKADAQESSLDQLLKSSAINKMFRQIASAIHPDREMDAQRKLDRNKLMSDLARARDEQDIPTIFAMYAEHVGKPPLEFIGADIERVITLLKAQSERLRRERDDIIYANPLHGAIYERFFNKSKKQVELAVAQHQKQQQQSIYTYNETVKRLKTIKVLKQFLQERADLKLFDALGAEY